MSRWLRRSFAPLALALLSGFVASCASRPESPPPSAASPLLEKPLPEFRRSALDGTSVETKALAGRVVVLELFSEHCVPCAVSLPSAEEAHRSRPEVTFIGLSVDDDAGGAARMVERHRLTFPVVHDEGRMLAGRLRLTELPATVIADKQGTVRWVGTHALSTDELLRAIDGVAGRH